ncbi:MAG: periplasmic protein TonB [Sphingomonadales bacterium]|jgi:protein TonB|nr:periplasmic protein TonB [Sphingomonadales bacterium]
MSGPTNKRFVRSARMLLAFQFVAAAGATGLAIWAATKVQDVVDQRDLLRRRVTELEARRAPAPPTAGALPGVPPIGVDNGAARVPPPPPPPPPRNNLPHPTPTPPPRTGGPPVGAGPGSVLPVNPLPVRREAQVDPRYANALQPPYPPSEQRAQRGGTVRVRVTVAPDGRVTAVQQLEATNAAFGRATERQALSRWRFRPATLDGRPVQGSIVMTVHFRIEDP